MSAIKEMVSRFVERQGGRDGFYLAPIDGFHIIRMSEPIPPNGTLYKPSLCITLQGAKQVTVGPHVFDYGEMAFLLVAAEVPAMGRITTASPERPYINITVELDLGILREMMDELPERPVPTDDKGPAVFTAPLDGALAAALERMTALLERPEAVSILKPAIMREICYWLLTGPHAGEICKLVLPNTHLRRITDAIAHLRANFARPLRVDDLADIARMSRSSFHQHFKLLTTMTPLQFQKQLRLMEARRMMTTMDLSVASAAVEVGYESASQFSREYTRMFSKAPGRDVSDLKSLMAKVAVPDDIPSVTVFQQPPARPTPQPFREFEAMKVAI